MWLNPCLLDLPCMHDCVNRVTCTATFHMSVLVAQLNFKAILDTLLRKIYAIFLITPLWSICSHKLHFLNRDLKYGLSRVMTLFDVLYAFSDNIKKSVKNFSPYSWITKSETLWSVQALMCCKCFKRSVVNTANRHKCLQQGSEEFLHLTLQPSAVLWCWAAQ